MLDIIKEHDKVLKYVFLICKKGAEIEFIYLITYNWPMNYVRVSNTASFFKSEQTSRNNTSTKLLLYSFPPGGQVTAKKTLPQLHKDREFHIHP